MTTNRELKDWVEDVAALTEPAHIHWCDGSEAEADMLIERMLAEGILSRLNPETHPNCYIHRSKPNDVARVEQLTFICTKNREDAGPNNPWMDPVEANAKMNGLFAGAMQGRTMYVVPYLMGPYGSPYSRPGVEITDSPYVVLNMRLMTRMGAQALRELESRGAFVKGLHSTGDLDPDRRFIMHFPEELAIKSIGSGYGGNALLGKKCHALRIASWQAREEGWLAEHMLILGLESPDGEITYVAAAFPSACGKTNLAMLVPPASHKGWKIWTLGDDIAWMHPGPDGRLYAINPEAGFFGVAPGTSLKTNPNCMRMLGHNTIYTNVAETEDHRPWWEQCDEPRPEKLIDWQGRPYDPANGPAAHPNARFTVSASQCPSYSPEANAPGGVPISAIIFGGRRAELAPLVFEALDWRHGVFCGAAMASEMTAAAAGTVGQVRRDPMAMKPFCGYNFGDYWSHWLSFDKRLTEVPRIFHVNWFRKKDGKFMWPGFGDNMRVLEWIVNRCRGKVDAKRTAIGYLPAAGSLNIDGLNIGDETMRQLLHVEPQLWAQEMAGIREYFAEFVGRLPEELPEQIKRIEDDLVA